MSAVRPVAPGAVRWITRTLEDAGFATWAVGGAIRDALLGIETGDWDLATRARPEEVRRIFRRTVPIGIEHGTVGVLARDGVMYEVTTFRRDVETDGRHAVVAFATRIEDDLARRDFTINAIAWHPLREELLDPFDGARDLSDGVLRTVGVPEERFREDYLRVLRALRFAGRHDLRVEPETWSALQGLTAHLSGLSAERVREELIKVLAADPRPATSLELYRRSGALGVVYPELAALGAEAWDDVVRVTDALPRGRPMLRLAALLRSLPDAQAAAILVRLRLSNAATDRVARVAGAPPMPAADATDEARRRWLSRQGPDVLRGSCRIELTAARLGIGKRTPGEVVSAWRALRAVRRQAPPLSVRDLAIDGRDLKRLGLRPGPLFGEVLDALLDWVLEEPARNDPELLAERVPSVVEQLGEAERA